MKVFVTGKGGQLAWELENSKPDHVVQTVLGRAELDVSDRKAVFKIVEELKPDVVINAAAYTAVDKAESESELAYKVNRDGAKYLAEACKAFNARFLHVSTDFVFDGSQTAPYPTDAKTSPLGVYGASKLAGDNAVLDALPNSVIVRTAWVYSENGNNFVKTMLRLMAEKPQLGIVYDQVGTPTWAAGLAAWLWAVADKEDVSGIYHWTDAGVASWYDFAVAIQELAVERGLLEKAIPISPIPASAYPTPAKRPNFSVLDKASAEDVSGVQTVHWRQQLSVMLDRLAQK